jgi:pimeloyl-ACP methyl ester carboxylesterase
VIWQERGGSGDRTILFLHGLGATAAVWTGVRTAIDERGGVRWVAVDLGGHGGSDWQTLYSVGQLAAQLAPLIATESAPVIVGHSLGAYVGLALASGWFAARVGAVLGIGPKIAWSATDLNAARDLAARPLRCYASEDEAVERYRRVSGLAEQSRRSAPPGARVLRTSGGWRLAQDPATFGVAGAPFASLAAGAKCPVVLVRGERDPMVSLQELRAHAQEAYDIPGAAHNAHVETPRAVLALLKPLLERA